MLFWLVGCQSFCVKRRRNIMKMVFDDVEVSKINDELYNITNNSSSLTYVVQDCGAGVLRVLNVSAKSDIADTLAFVANMIRVDADTLVPYINAYKAAQSELKGVQEKKQDEYRVSAMVKGVCIAEETYTVSFRNEAVFKFREEYADILNWLIDKGIGCELSVEKIK